MPTTKLWGPCRPECRVCKPAQPHHQQPLHTSPLEQLRKVALAKPSTAGRLLHHHAIRPHLNHVRQRIRSNSSSSSAVAPVTACRLCCCWLCFLCCCCRPVALHLLGAAQALDDLNEHRGPVCPRTQHHIAQHVTARRVTRVNVTACETAVQPCMLGLSPSHTVSPLPPLAARLRQLTLQRP